MQVIIDGDNANTATTVMGYASNILRTVGADLAPPHVRREPPLAVEPRIWYNPELRSTLFLVPGLIAYIAMITAVTSTALSIVREKESGTMEQVRMAPIDTFSFIVGKTLPYFLISLSSAALIIGASMVLFGLPMRGNWLALLRGAVALPRRRARHRPAHFDRRRVAAGGVPDGAAHLAAADDDAVRLHLSDFEHAGGPADDHLRRAGALLPRRAARHRAEGLAAVALHRCRSRRCRSMPLRCWRWRRCGWRGSEA